MPGQRERDPSSTTASHLLSPSLSSTSGQLSHDSATPLADSSSCDALGFLRQPEPFSFDGPSRFHLQGMAPEYEAHPAGSHAASLLEQPGEEFDPITTTFQNGYPDEALSAFMSVPHYPETTGNRTRISVSEFVNAVIEPAEYHRRPSNSTQEIPGPQISSPVELYTSDSEMTDALSEVGGVPLNEYNMEQMRMAEFATRFGRASTQNNYIAVSETTEEDRATDQTMYHEPHTSRHGPIGGSTTEDDDDTRKFYLDGADDDYATDSHSTAFTDDGRSHVSNVDLDDFYRDPGYTYGPQTSGFDPASSHEDHTNSFPDAEDVNADQAVDPHFTESVLHGTTQETNYDIDQFISQWFYQSSTAAIPMLSLSPPVLPQHTVSNIMRWTPSAKIIRPSGYLGDFYDIQQIPWWEKLRVRRVDARQVRDQSYEAYQNLQRYPRQRAGTRLPEEEFYFQGKSMYTSHKATIEHFQLRNLMSVPAYNTVHFAHESKLYSWVPAYDDLQCLIDLSVPTVESGFQGPVKISSMKTAVGVSIAGGFFGEYAVRAMGVEDQGSTQGYVTKDPNGITTNIDIIPSRTSRSPIGVFASNDRHVRTLDCETNTFLTDHELTHAVNCTSTSPDGRLRVIVGDSPDAWVVEADTGRPVYPLRGHHDFGFACAWSPDMMQIATSNQDKSAIIWDVRTWRPLERLESDVAGYRSLRFSPVGGGPRTLLLCEPADRIVIVNAQTYQSRQVHDFFGEVGGADYSPDGSTIWAANTDELFGGFMEYDRRQWGQQFGLQQSPNEWVKEADLDDDERCILSERERKSRHLWNLSDEEHENLLLC
ncbi:hypothetical protein BDW74DRAFT_180760 [Aspergillus multicolor]|uniref:WD40 repeat domain-containing protein n=1 Tax=Aspergillus multicolor TaxID=41759 RepID=UPI003CCD7A79